MSDGRSLDVFGLTLRYSHAFLRGDPIVTTSVLAVAREHKPCRCRARSVGRVPLRWLSQSKNRFGHPSHSTMQEGSAQRKRLGRFTPLAASPYGAAQTRALSAIGVPLDVFPEACALRTQRLHTGVGNNRWLTVRTAIRGTVTPACQCRYHSIYARRGVHSRRGYGAIAARLAPDRKVGSSNRSALARPFRVVAALRVRSLPGLCLTASSTCKFRGACGHKTKGPPRIRTAIAGFRVQCANHYTMMPHANAIRP